MLRTLTHSAAEVVAISRWPCATFAGQFLRELPFFVDPAAICRIMGNAAHIFSKKSQYPLYDLNSLIAP